MTSIQRVTPAVIAIAAALGWAVPVQAQETDEAAALRAEVARMRAQMEAMASRIDTLEGDLAEAAAEPEPVAVESLEGDHGWTFEPFGRLQVDAGIVDAPDAISDAGLGFASEIRRARIGVAGDLPGDFAYKIEVDFAEGEAELTDAILGYETGDAVITIGQHNNFQGLDELTRP